MNQATERAFETYVEEILLSSGGWKSGNNAEWDLEIAPFAHQFEVRSITLVFQCNQPF